MVKLVISLQPELHSKHSYRVNKWVPVLIYLGQVPRYFSRSY